MHGCSSGSVLLVNAEVDSMGGVVDGGDGVATKPSPRRSAIEKAQIELRQEYGVREKRRRELEFLEKGGNPLDFKFGNAASVSMQSTSLTDQHPEQIVTSEAKGSFALTASPHGDSVESSGRPGPPSVCEPNSADNLMLFDGVQNAKELGNSAAFGLPRKAYRRRIRSRPNRDSARSTSTDLIPSCGGQASLLSTHHAPKDAKGLIIDADEPKDCKISSNSNTKPTTSLNDSMVVKTVNSGSQFNVELDGVPGVESTPVDLASGELDCVVAIRKVDNKGVSGQMNGFRNTKRDRRSIPNEGQTNSAVLNTKGLDSESSCTQTSLSLDGNNDSEMCTTLRNIDSDGKTKEQTLETPSMEGNKLVKEKNEIKGDEICAITNDDHCSIDQFHEEDSSVIRLEEELEVSEPGLQNAVKNTVTVEGIGQDCLIASETEIKPINLLGFNSAPLEENACSGTHKGPLDSSNQEHSEIKLSIGAFAVDPQQQICSRINLKFDNKVHQDSILEEADFIETKRKRIAELSVGTVRLENRQKSHWDFVLEEVAWLANDFAQERLWKITAAAQICHQVAFNSRLRIQEQNLCWKPKELAHTLAKAVLEFWHSVQDRSKELELQQCPGKDFAHAIQGYAMRFLQHNNSSHVQHCAPEAPVTPDKTYDFGVLDMSWEDHLTEENLFYTIPPGAMEVYRKCIESHILDCEKTGSSTQEEVETSGCNAVTEFGSQENVFEEEGETSTYYLPGAFEGSMSSKFAQKKQKNLSFKQCMENKFSGQQSGLIRKRPGNSLNVSFHTKRMRTASRPKVLSPFSAGPRAPNKTDASSGDTNSFQDEQSTLHGGFQIPNSLEVESMGNFEKKLPFESAEVSNKPKKKKAKHLGSTYEQRWQLDSNFHNVQRDHLKRRSETYQPDSNGSSGLFGQHVMKKPKMMRQSLDNSFDNLTPMAGSIPSPVASQMSNMSNPNKLMKVLVGRRKAKAVKMPAGQLDLGSPWSQFEEQALIVLVHDMGPNWELISDAINSSLRFKSIFRKPKECKERHNVLMDSTTADGADSAEDSGSSQPYPSTLPGIPKGSARQLFQHLQGPVEEDTLKSHFEKIIRIGQKLHYPRTQNGNLEPKQLQQPHSSHTVALSQACPNNLGGGPCLTPLDLCDATASSPDVLSVGYQVTNTSGLPISNQASGANSSLQGSSSVVLGSNVSTQSGPLNASVRDGRYSIAKTAALSVDEQQRALQYNQMLPGRNVPQSGLPGPVCVLPGGNSMGIMRGGLNRSLPMTRPGFQGIASQPVMNSPSMLSSGMVAMPSPVGGPGQGNPLLRPRDALHMMRPSQNPENQRQMMVPELQMQQVSQGNNHGVTAFSGLSSSFSNQTAPPVQSYPAHHQQPHAISPQRSHLLNNPHHPHIQRPNNHSTNTQHQAYAVRFAKQRQQQQQRLLLQQQQQQKQQQQLASSNGLMPCVQSQSQLPMSSPQNSSHIQTQASSPPVSMSPARSPMSQPPQNHQVPHHGVGRNHPQAGGSGLPNQMGKQRQHQQFQPAGRHHPQQQSQCQPLAKHVKGVARGTPNDSSLPNGLSVSPVNQSAEKGEQAMHLMHAQGLYSKQLGPPPHSSNQFQSHQNMFSGQATSSTKQHHLCNQNHISSVTDGPTLSQPQLKLVNQNNPTAHRLIQSNRQVNSNRPSKLQAKEAQVEQHQAQIGATVATPQSCISSNVPPPVVSSPSATQQSTIGDPPLTNSVGAEPEPQVSQGLGHRQSSGGLPPIGPDGGTQQKPPTLQSPVQEHQTQILQSGNNSLYVSPGSSRME
ncbi:hypothetical protein LguiA_020633 [Lonicera macranthoides]